MLLNCVFFCLNAQQNSKDSIKKVLSNLEEGNDTIKLRILAHIGSVCETNEILNYSMPAIELAEKLLSQKFTPLIKSNIKYHKALAYNNLGFLYDNNGETNKALGYYDKSLNLHKEIGNKAGIAGELNNIGYIYYNLGDIKKALDYWQQSLRLEEESGYQVGVANSLNNLGAAYENLSDTASAYECYRKSAAIQKKIDNKLGISVSLLNLAHVYHKQKQLDNALNYYLKALELQEDIEDNSGIALTLSAIGLINSHKGKFDEAIKYLNQGLAIRRSLGDKSSMAQSFMQLGSVYFDKFQTTKNSDKKTINVAFVYADSSLSIAKNLGFPEIIKDAEKLLSEIETKRGNHLSAFEHYSNFVIYRDSISNQETRKAGMKSQLKYEFEKKEAVLKEQQEKEKALSNEINHRQEIVIWSVGIGFLLVIIFSVFVVRSLQLTRKQKQLIENKQLEILDSIRYAKRIQNSMLPTDSFINKTISRLKI